MNKKPEASDFVRMMLDALPNDITNVEMTSAFTLALAIQMSKISDEQIDEASKTIFDACLQLRKYTREAFIAKYGNPKDPTP